MNRTQAITIGTLVVLALIVSGFWIKYQERTKPGPSAAVALKGSPLHLECTPVLTEMTKADDCDEKLRIYNQNVAKCGEVYDSAPKEKYNYRLNDDGIYYDRILTNAICYAIKGDIDKAKSIIHSVPNDSDRVVEHGPTACEMESFKEGFISSLDFPKGNCVKASVGKDLFLKALNSGDFADLKDLTRLGKPIFLEMDSNNEFTCPVALEMVIKTLSENSTKSTWSLAKEQKENSVLHKFYFISSAGNNVTAIFSIEKGCEILTAIFVQSKAEE